MSAHAVLSPEQIRQFYDDGLVITGIYPKLS